MKPSSRQASQLKNTINQRIQTRRISKLKIKVGSHGRSIFYRNFLPEIFDGAFLYVSQGDRVAIVFMFTIYKVTNSGECANMYPKKPESNKNNN
jgi:hypothetical protein